MLQTYQSHSLMKMPAKGSDIGTYYNDFLFKIVLIGDCGTGKTCISKRFLDGTFREDQNTTVGVDFAKTFLKIGDKRVELNIWDTAGQERFHTMAQTYYRKAHCVIIVYDITKRSTFLSVTKWLEEIQKYSETSVLVALFGNKADQDNSREVELEEAEALGRNNNMVLVEEISAKSNMNINEVFQFLGTEMLRQQETDQWKQWNDLDIIRLNMGAASSPGVCGNWFRNFCN